MWQDWIISSVSWVFVASLVPTILHPEHKPALSTSLLTGVGMVLLALTYFSLGLFLSALSSSLLAAGWLVLAWQRFRMKKAAPAEAGAADVRA